MRGVNPLTIDEILNIQTQEEIYATLTPSDSRSDWTSESAAATAAAA